MHIYDSEFFGNFFAHIIFPNPPTQNFKFRFTQKCVGVLFSRSHTRIQNKILHQMIWIGMGLSILRLRKGGFFLTGSFTPTQTTIVAPRVL